MTTQTKAQKAERQAAIERIREWVKPGDTLWTDVKHVSQSGMQRSIRVYLVEDSGVRNISYTVAQAIDHRHDGDRGAVKTNGGGMDMGFALVYALSSSLWPQGAPCSGKGCHSNDHSNRVEPPFGVCTEHSSNPEEQERLGCTPWIHSDGGYALKQRWM